MKKLSRAGLGLALSSFVALGGPALAAIPGPDGMYTGCYTRSSGALRLIDPARQACVAWAEVQVAWSLRGPQGPKGDPGAPGLPGAGAVIAPEPAGARCAAGGVRIADGLGNTAYVCNAAPAPCRGRPGGTCSATPGQACAYAKDCPQGETCVAPSPRFIDHGATVTDRRTCLEWEKKTGVVGDPVNCDSAATCPDPHDVNNRYTFSDGSQNGLTPLFNGTAATVFLAQLNGTAFAGRTDWRLPSIDDGAGTDAELESLLLAPWPTCPSNPCIDPVLGPVAGWYWAMGSAPPPFMWVLSFGNGSGDIGKRSFNVAARAVRGGP